MGINTITYPILSRYIDTDPVVLMGNLFMRRGVLKHYPGQSKYAALFIRAVHDVVTISMDIDPRHGGRAWDLGKPLVGWAAMFGVLFNGGTGEHIDDQAAFWRNCHRIVRPGGVMIHVVPLIGGWAGHSPWLYTRYFLRQLAQCNGYDVLERIPFRAGRGEALCMVLRHNGGGFNRVPWRHVKAGV